MQTISIKNLLRSFPAPIRAATAAGAGQESKKNLQEICCHFQLDYDEEQIPLSAAVACYAYVWLHLNCGIPSFLAKILVCCNEWPYILPVENIADVDTIVVYEDRYVQLGIGARSFDTWTGKYRKLDYNQKASNTHYCRLNIKPVILRLLACGQADSQRDPHAANTELGTAENLETGPVPAGPAGRP